MKPIPNPSVNLELWFSNKDEALRLLNTLATDRRVSVNIMKARVSDRSAWLGLTLEGQSPRIFEVASLLQDAATVKDPSWKPHSRAS